MPLLRKLLRLACLCLLALLAACGGGGGGDASGGGVQASHVTFDPSVLTYTMPAGGQSADGRKWLPVTMTIPKLGAGPVWLVIVQDQAIFENEPVEVTAVGGDQYRALLPMRISMAQGTYTGDITFLICYDTACANRHPGSGAKLPYQITVTPGIQLTVQVNGVPVTGDTLRVNDGDAVTLQSSVPVHWRLGLGGGVAAGEAQTDTTWSATLRNGVTPVGIARLDVYADTPTDPVAEAIQHFEINPAP